MQNSVDERNGNLNTNNNDKPLSEEIISEDEISLVDIFRILWRQKWFIIIFTLVFTLIGFFYFKSKQKTVYTYSLKILTTPMTWKQYNSFKANLETTNYTNDFYDKLDNELKKIFPVRDLKFEFNYDPVNTILNNKKVFASTYSFIISFKSQVNDSNNAEKILRFYIDNYFIFKFSKFIVEDYFSSKINSININKKNFSDFLINKIKLQKQLNELLKIRNKYKDFYNKNVQNILIYNTNTKEGISIEQRILNTEVSISENDLNLENYIFDLLKYNLYNELLKESLNYSYSNDKNLNNYFQFIKEKINDYNFNIDNILGEISKKYNDFEKNSFSSDLKDMFILEKNGIVDKIDFISKQLNLNIKIAGFEYISTTRSIYKYVILIFVASGFIALFLAFVIDFFAKNKDEIFKKE